MGSRGFGGNGAVIASGVYDQRGLSPFSFSCCISCRREQAENCREGEDGDELNLRHWQLGRNRFVTRWNDRLAVVVAIASLFEGRGQGCQYLLRIAVKNILEDSCSDTSTIYSLGIGTWLIWNINLESFKRPSLLCQGTRLESAPTIPRGSRRGFDFKVASLQFT